VAKQYAQYLKRGAAKLRRVAHRSLKTRSELARMERSANPAVRSIARAIEATLDGRLTPEEAERIHGIEALRTELLASTDPVDSAAGRGEDAATVGEVCRKASKPHRWAFLLFRIIRERRPETCVELGTCLGVSAAYAAAALELNGAGSLVTLEGSAARAARATRNLERLRVGAARGVTGLFQDTLGPVLEQGGDVDYAFIDGHHREDATLSYFDQIAAHAAPGAVVVLDDVAWSEGMKRAWESVRTRDLVAASIDLFVMGICVIGRSANADERFGVSIG